MMMGEEGMMMEDEMLDSSEVGEDEWANLEIASVDSAAAAAEFLASNGIDRVLFDTDKSNLYWRSENALKAQSRFLAANARLFNRH